MTTTKKATTAKSGVDRAVDALDAIAKALGRIADAAESLSGRTKP
jgi:hypothetical protein